MKFYIFVFAGLLLLSTKMGIGQNSDNKWAIGIGAHAVDHTAIRPTALSGIYDFNDWSIQPPISRVWVARNINHRFNVVVEAVLGSVDNYRFGIEDEFFLDASVGLQFRIGNDQGFFRVVDPYIVSSIGFHLYDYQGAALGGNLFVTQRDVNESLDEGSQPSDAQLAQLAAARAPHTQTSEDKFLSAGLGVGFNIWITEGFGLNYQVDYKHIPAGNSDYQDFINHKVGFVFRFGSKDTDQDGIYDSKDECPEVAGLEEFKGCPDTDGDKIVDSEDDCPEVAGLEEFNGCPDTDLDGIMDSADSCPTEKGSIANRGCPDSDGDGFIDRSDRCPREPGVAPDGCPTISEAEIGAIVNIARTIYFKTGKFEIADESKTKLEQVARIVKKYPKIKFNINGYTDSVGRESSNLKLSDKRAVAVRHYLVHLGVQGRQLRAKGFGEINPIATNKTKEGRAQNRRTEIILVK